MDPWTLAHLPTAWNASLAEEKAAGRGRGECTVHSLYFLPSFPSQSVYLPVVAEAEEEGKEGRESWGLREEEEECSVAKEGNSHVRRYW